MVDLKMEINWILTNFKKSLISTTTKSLWKQGKIQ